MRALALAALLPLAAQAAPFVQADLTDARCTACEWEVTGLPAQSVAVEPGNPPTCKRDVSAVAIGTFTASVTCVAQDPIWGTQRSPKASKDFARPGAAQIPSSPVLVP
jgi:hypothetical protein